MLKTAESPAVPVTIPDSKIFPRIEQAIRVNNIAIKM